MDESTISALVAELTPLLVGRAAGKIFQLDHQSLAIDFGLRSEGYLFISASPANPRFYLIKRKVRELEKQSCPLSQFSLTLRKELSGTRVATVEKLPGDRIVRLSFKGEDELSQTKRRSLIVQLTGRSANLVLVDDSDVIIAQMRPSPSLGQTAGARYEPPSPQAHSAKRSDRSSIANAEGRTLSESLDSHYRALDASQVAQSQLAAARAKVHKEISRRRKLLKQLEKDLSEHGDAEHQKRLGDLLLANVGTAKRTTGRLRLLDYFAEGAPEIEIEIDDNLTIPEEASRRFEMYARSKRARKQIASRIEKVKGELLGLEQRQEKLESSDALPLTFQEEQSARSPKAKAAAVKRIPGTRRYLSSDSYEILVGRAARDNDNLTFKVAKPHDLWLHAGDYSGSHVIIRNASRKEIPHRTLIEAAQLAAYFSQAKNDPKVDVHYTERKFVSKPKGGAPGLVRLQRFKNITVAPAEKGERLK